jgi:CHAT domain-containing protein
MYTNLEVDSILNLFSSHQVLSKKQATKDALLKQIAHIREANYLHFSCHGSFNLNSPQDSCLLLAESVDKNNNLDLSKCLTLSNLFERDYQLDSCRLVVLSACETGLVDFDNGSDEFISLPSGFLYAGSTSVVSSLWTVNDFSTAFLMIKFYENLQSQTSVAVALNQAQIWLRNITKAELKTWITANSLSLNPTMQRNLSRRLHKLQDTQKPFQEPFHWAAFCAIGQ